jgi:small subunit ribosomal protein S2
MTNFQTVKKSVARLKILEEKHNREEWGSATKKEVLGQEKIRVKLERSFGGIKEMAKVPDVIFVVDPNKEKIAVLEAIKLDIPIVAIVDTNCDPDEVDYVIPGNDDAIRAIKLISSKLAEAILEVRPLPEVEEIEEEPEASEPEGEDEKVEAAEADEEVFIDAEGPVTAPKTDIEEGETNLKDEK